MIRALFAVLALVAWVRAVRRYRRQRRAGVEPKVAGPMFAVALFSMMALWGPAVGAYS